MWWGGEGVWSTPLTIMNSKVLLEHKPNLTWRTNRRLNMLNLANMGWHMAAQIVQIFLLHLNYLQEDLDRLAEPGRGNGPEKDS